MPFKVCIYATIHHNTTVWLTLNWKHTHTHTKGNAHMYNFKIIMKEVTNLKYIKQDCIHSKMDMDMTWCGIPSHHDSLQRLSLASNLIHNFKVAPYHMAKGNSPDTSKGKHLTCYFYIQDTKTLLQLLTDLQSINIFLHSNAL